MNRYWDVLLHNNAQLQDLSRWLFKTTTNFYGMELDLPWWFGLGCFGYSLAGVMMFLTKPKWISCRKYNFFPYNAFALYLIFIQGPLSFIADYQNMSNDSIFHVIDRFSASSSLVLELVKIGAMFGSGRARSVTCVLYATAAVVAIVSFFLSQAAQDNTDRDGFVFWHNMWHMYPVVASIIISIDFFGFGEFDERDTRQASLSSSPRPVPLSTLLMRQVSFLNNSSPAPGLRIRMEASDNNDHKINSTFDKIK